MALTKISTDGVKDDAVTAGKIPANAVGSSELADNAVDTAAIADDAVTGAKIAAATIGHSKIADESITLAKLSHGTSSTDGKFLRSNNGADPTFETVSIPAGTTINNNGDNRVLTGTGSANTIQGETQLLFDANGLLYIQAPDGGNRYFFGETGNSQSAQLSLYDSSDSQKVRISAGGGDSFFTGGNLGIGTNSPVNNSGYGGLTIDGSSGSLLSLLQNGTENLRIFGDSNPALQFEGVLRLFSGVSGGSAVWGITPNGTTTGANSVSFNLKSTIQHTTGVMAVSSAYNAGDLYVRIDNLYNLTGNAWWTFSGLIISSQVQGGLGGHHSIVSSFTITGLGSWGSFSKNDIVNSCNASVSQSGSNFVELQFDFNDSSRGANTVICNGGTFDPPRISFH